MTILAIVAVVLAIAGVVKLVQGSIGTGVVLLIVACLVGPGGYSLFA